MDEDRTWTEMIIARNNAEMNAKYWEKLSVRIKWQNNVIKIVLGIASSTAFAGFGFWKTHQDVFSYIMGIVGIISTVIVPLLKRDKLLSEVEIDRIGWLDLAAEYNEMVTELSTKSNWEKAMATFAKLRRKEVGLARRFDAIQDDKALIDDAQDEVERMHAKPA